MVGRRGFVKRGGRGCLELGALVFFAVLFGAFTASTWFRYRGTPPGGESTPAESTIARQRGIDRSRIRVDVRNGSGREGAAGHVTEFLRAEGFDVVDYGNADRFDYARTFVVDRGGSGDDARDVAAALQGVSIRTTRDSSPYLDVTVVVGGDFDAILAQRDSNERSRWRRWLDRLR